MAKAFLFTIFIPSCASGAGGVAAKGTPVSAEWFGSASQSTIYVDYTE